MIVMKIVILQIVLVRMVMHDYLAHYLIHQQSKVNSQLVVIYFKIITVAVMVMDMEKIIDRAVLDVYYDDNELYNLSVSWIIITITRLSFENLYQDMLSRYIQAKEDIFKLSVLFVFLFYNCSTHCAIVFRFWFFF